MSYMFNNESQDIVFHGTLQQLVVKVERGEMVPFGYRGILNLLECIQNEWSDRWRSKERRYAARW